MKTKQFNSITLEVTNYNWLKITFFKHGQETLLPLINKWDELLTTMEIAYWLRVCCNLLTVTQSEKLAKKVKEMRDGK
jgi:hypothetical protein